MGVSASGAAGFVSGQIEYVLSEEHQHKPIQFLQQAITMPLRHSEIPSILHPLYKQLVLKMILNSHSTLVAGRMGCYVGNLMTSVKASNEKLINRAIALTGRVLSATNFFQRRLPPLIKDRITHDEIAETLYRMMLMYQYGDSIVFNTRDAILTEYEKLCYVWLFHHIQRPSESLLRRFFSSMNSETKTPVPLVSDIEIAVALTEEKPNILCIEGGGTYTYSV